jgi:hypothetical protein
MGRYTESAETEVEHDSRSAWASTARRFPIDLMLREEGFRIADRPAKGEPIWVRDRKRFAEVEAVKTVLRKRNEAAGGSRKG